MPSIKLILIFETAYLILQMYVFSLGKQLKIKKKTSREYLMGNYFGNL